MLHDTCLGVIVVKPSCYYDAGFLRIHFNGYDFRTLASLLRRRLVIQRCGKLHPSKRAQQWFDSVCELPASQAEPLTKTEDLKEKSKT
jgi:hypothetical protein